MLFFTHYRCLCMALCLVCLTTSLSAQTDDPETELVPSSIVLSDTALTVLPDEEFCVTATVLDQFGNPLPGVSILSDVNELIFGRADISDENGEVDYCLVPQPHIQYGLLTVGFYYRGGERVSAVVTVTDDPENKPVPSSLTVEPENQTVMQGDNGIASAVVTVTALDQFGKPLPGVKVFADINGTPLDPRYTNLEGNINFGFSTTNTETRVYTFYFQGGEAVTATINVIPDPDPDIRPEVVSFNLIDAETDQVIGTIHENDTIKLSSLPDPTHRLSIQAITNPEETGSVSLSLRRRLLNGTFADFAEHRHVENYAPYALYGDIAGDYSGRVFPATSYVILAFPYSQKNREGLAGSYLSVFFTIVDDLEKESLAVTGFDLYDAVTDDKIMDLTDGAVINLSELAHNDLTVIIRTLPYFVGSLRVRLTGPISVNRRENMKPYTLFRNNSSNFFGEPFVPGNYTLTVTPYSEVNTKGERGTPLEVNFIVVENTDMLTRSTGWKNKSRKEVSDHQVDDAITDYIAYPIPFNEHLFLKKPADAGKLNVILYDIHGKMHSIEVSEEEEALKIDTQLPSGIYFLQISSENQLIKSLKVSKK